MRQLIEFEAEDGTLIYVEVADADLAEGISDAGVESKIIRAQETFESALHGIRKTADTVIRHLSNLSDAPDEVQVEFGLTMTAEAGAIIASAGIEANYRITLTWKNRRDRS